jgi:ABC-2 type transport system permease protein
VGLGALVPNQVAAIVIVIAFTQFVEPILRLAASLSEVTASIGRFLPGAASDALVGASFYSIASAGGTQSLDWWQGGLVLLAIGVLATLIGGATTWRRDVQ